VSEKVLIFHHAEGIGGATITLLNVVSCLVKAGYMVTVVCAPGEEQRRRFVAAGAVVTTLSRPLRQFSHFSGFEKSALHPRFWIDAGRQMLDLRYLERFIRQAAPDIVHLNAITLSPVAIAAKRAGAKVSLMVQETGVRGMLGIRTAWLRWVLSKWVDQVFFISEYDRNWFDLKGPRQEVVPNWVDEVEFGKLVTPASARVRLRIPLDANVVLFVGGMYPLKGAIELFLALESLADMDNLLVLFAGPRRMIDHRRLSPLQTLNRRRRVWMGLDYDSRAAKILRRSTVRRHVRLVGPQSKMAELYCASNVVVFPATMPHQSRPAIEGGYARIPVVASDFPHVREFLKHGENALLVPPGDPKALGEALRRVLTDKAFAAQISSANHAAVKEKHDRGINTQRFLAAFRGAFSSANSFRNPEESI